MTNIFMAIIVSKDERELEAAKIQREKCGGERGIVSALFRSNL